MESKQAENKFKMLNRAFIEKIEGQFLEKNRLSLKRLLLWGNLMPFLWMVQ